MESVSLKDLAGVESVKRIRPEDQDIDFAEVHEEIVKKGLKRKEQEDAQRNSFDFPRVYKKMTGEFLVGEYKDLMDFLIEQFGKSLVMITLEKMIFYASHKGLWEPDHLFNYLVKALQNNRAERDSEYESTPEDDLVAAAEARAKQANEYLKEVLKKD